MLLLTFILFAEACSYILLHAVNQTGKNSEQTTLCVFTLLDQVARKSDKGLIRLQLIATILQAHNTRRQTVANGQQPNQPSLQLANMYELTYRMKTLLLLLKDGLISARNTRAGQNVAISWGSSTDSSPWFDEVSQFSSSDINPFTFSGATGHYTQVCWAETRQVGCGYAFYNGPNRNTKLYVCNYGPAGNIIGGEMYRTGSPCSGCTTCSTNYDGLCSP